VDNRIAVTQPTWSPERQGATLVTVTSGKGGVGKSNIAANVAIGLARSGKRVRLIDADLSLGNIDILLNVHSRYTLSDVINGRKHLEDVIQEGPHGLEILCATSGSERLADLEDFHRGRLIHELGELRHDADFIILDTAAGLAKSVTGFCLAADHVWVVTTPEGPAMADAYSLIKVLVRNGFMGHLSLVVNQADGPLQGKRVYQQVAKVAHHFLDAHVHYAGSLPRDEHLIEAVRNRTPVVMAYPRSPIAVSLASLAANLGEGATFKNESQPFLKKVVDWFC
jgi:flagellar biosynthesis protein FlhG